MDPGQGELHGGLNSDNKEVIADETSGQGESSAMAELDRLLSSVEPNAMQAALAKMVSLPSEEHSISRSKLDVYFLLFARRDYTDELVELAKKLAVEVPGSFLGLLEACMCARFKHLGGILRLG